MVVETRLDSHSLIVEMATVLDSEAQAALD
jgi:hypothetical protein